MRKGNQDIVALLRGPYVVCGGGGGGGDTNNNNDEAKGVPIIPQRSSESNKPPAEYLCPIVMDVMTDPVICADGFTYERSAIDEWLRSHNTSPKTNEQLETRNLIPNRNLKILIEEWKGRNA